MLVLLVILFTEEMLHREEMLSIFVKISSIVYIVANQPRVLFCPSKLINYCKYVFCNWQPCMNCNRSISLGFSYFWLIKNRWRCLGHVNFSK